MSTLPPIGTICWRDLTVNNAEVVQDFYSAVVGWVATPSPADGGDFNISLPHDPEPIAGICYARGSNANLPPQWLIYIVVADVKTSARICVEQGGRVLDGPRPMGGHHFCMIEDPAGAVAALISD